MAAPPLLAVSGVTRLYEYTRHGVRDVSFTLEDSSILGLVGQNGSGKSTLLRCILGLERYSGRVEILGHSPRDWVCLGGIAAGVLDDVSYHRGMRVRDCLAYYSGLAGSPPAGSEVIELLSLEDVWRRRFGTLSLGWRQRVLIACAIVSKPKLLLLDEPFNGLDPLIVHNLMEHLRGLVAEGSSIILASHHLELVERMTRRSLVLDGGVCEEVALDEREQTLTPRGRILARGASEEEIRKLVEEVGGSVATVEAGAIFIDGITASHLNEHCVRRGIVLSELRYVEPQLSAYLQGDG